MHPNPVMQHIIAEIDHKHERQQQIDQLTHCLIKEQSIQIGDNLYLHLGVGKRCDNTKAIQSWIERILDDINVDDEQETYKKLKRLFLQRMPETL